MATIALISPQEIGNLKTFSDHVNDRAYTHCERSKKRPSYWNPTIITPCFPPLLIAQVDQERYVIDGVTRAVFSYIDGLYAEIFAIEDRSDVLSVVPRKCLSRGNLEKTLARFDRFQISMQSTGANQQTIAALAANYFDSNFT